MSKYVKIFIGAKPVEIHFQDSNELPSILNSLQRFSEPQRPIGRSTVPTSTAPEVKPESRNKPPQPALPNIGTTEELDVLALAKRPKPGAQRVSPEQSEQRLEGCYAALKSIGKRASAREIFREIYQIGRTFYAAGTTEKSVLSAVRNTMSRDPRKRFISFEDGFELVEWQSTSHNSEDLPRHS